MPNKTDSEQTKIERARIIAILESRNEFVQDVDGFIYWWPSAQSQGHHAAHHLRWIADELDARNKPWNDQIEKELGEKVPAKDYVPHCSECAGTGLILPYVERKKCLACHGTGNQSPSQKIA